MGSTIKQTFLTFPSCEDAHLKNVNVSNEIFGNRFHLDQSLYEYLIEFLLVFVSPKEILGTQFIGKMQFHNNTDNYIYYAETMMGLRRFMFYDVSKKDSSIQLDNDAYVEYIEAIKKKMDFGVEDKTVAIEAIQDLLRGFSVVLKKRTWCAQQVLPICPEMVFCEAMPNQKNREKKAKEEDNVLNSVVDTSFQFTQRNFLARGGEIYYLHILEALQNDIDDSRRKRLNSYLKHLLTSQSQSISKILRFIQDAWYEHLDVSEEKIRDLHQQYSLGYIPTNAYGSRGSKTIDELINYLSSEFHHIKKIDILAKGIMFQIMRMMYVASTKKCDIKEKPWIVDMTCNSSKAIKQISSQAFRDIEDDFKTVIKNTAYLLKDRKGFISEKKSGTMEKRIRDGQKESIDIFRSKGKEIGCIIPIKGANERLTLSEDLLRFLVLSLLSPGEKVTFNMFLDKLYDHFGIVVGSEQYEKFYDELTEDQLTIKNSLYENQICFQNFLKSTGFLKELSDSTSLVINPYDEINIVQEGEFH